MSWQQPSFTELAMNAEIGAYQNDFDDQNVPVVGKSPALDRSAPRDNTFA
jgi:hypothetical protein